MHFKADFLRSEQGRCLQNEGTDADMMPDDNSVYSPSFDDQCKYAYGRDYTKYNGRYQGITLQNKTNTYDKYFRKSNCPHYHHSDMTLLFMVAQRMNRY